MVVAFISRFVLEFVCTGLLDLLPKNSTLSDSVKLLMWAFKLLTDM